MNEMNAWLRQIRLQRMARAIEVHRLANEPGGLVLAIPNHARHLGALISPSVTEPGRWRVTWFDVDGVSGDSTRDSKAEVIALALREGYADVDRGLLRHLQHTPRFLDGCAAASTRLKMAG